MPYSSDGRAVGTNPMVGGSNPLTATKYTIYVKSLIKLTLFFSWGWLAVKLAISFLWKLLLNIIIIKRENGNYRKSH